MTEQAEQARLSADARGALTRVASVVLREQDLGAAMRRLAEEAVRLLGVGIVAIGVPDEFAGVVRYDVAEGPGAATFDASPVDINESLAGSVMLAGVAIHVDGRDPSALDRLRLGAGATSATTSSRSRSSSATSPSPCSSQPTATTARCSARTTRSCSRRSRAFASIAVRTSRALGRERARAEALARLRQTQTDAEARRETLARVVETQERERRRLAQDLHDRTAGGLTSVLFALRRLEADIEDDAQRETLAEARSGVAAAIEDVRDLISDLRPKVLDDFGLGAALERLCETIARRSGLRITPELGDGLDALPADVATAAYRITQEALGNIVRHADASNAGVSAALIDGRLVLTIDDDGKGFGPGTLGYGVEGMIERARMVGGRLELERPAGGGARIRFETRVDAA